MRTLVGYDIGKRRIRTFFAWLPVRIPWEIHKPGKSVWLERVTVEEELYPSGTWRPIREVLHDPAT